MQSDVLERSEARPFAPAAPAREIAPRSPQRRARCTRAGVPLAQAESLHPPTHTHTPTNPTTIEQACRSLKLPRDTTLRACAEARNAPRGGPPRPLSAHLGRSRLTLDSSPAEARNEYTAGRLRKDFHAGLRELAEQAGEADAAALTARFELPVFAVSSVDYQKLAGLRPGDGPPRVWRAGGEGHGRQLEPSTSLLGAVPAGARRRRVASRASLGTCGGRRSLPPPLPRLLPLLLIPPTPLRQALVRRREISLRRCLGMRDFARSSLTLLECESRLPQAWSRGMAQATRPRRVPDMGIRVTQATRDSLRAAYDQRAAEAQRRLKAACKAAEDAVRASFDTQVAPQLQQGAASAASEALSTAGAWGISVTQGGLHWATYKATTRRHGVFRRRSATGLAAVPPPRAVMRRRPCRQAQHERGADGAHPQGGVGAVGARLPLGPPDDPRLAPRRGARRARRLPRLLHRRPRGRLRPVRRPRRRSVRLARVGARRSPVRGARGGAKAAARALARHRADRAGADAARVRHRHRRGRHRLPPAARGHPRAARAGGGAEDVSCGRGRRAVRLSPPHPPPLPLPSLVGELCVAESCVSP